MLFPSHDREECHYCGISKPASNFDQFRDALKDALNAKLAKTLISRMGGELEKQVNELKANPATRAKITLAINELIELK